MRYNITIETDEALDSSLFKVYLDVKKRSYITKKPIPKTLEKLDCDCKSNIKYCVNK